MIDGCQWTGPVLLLVALAAMSGGVVGGLLASRSVRGHALDARVLPLQAAVAELVDRFDHASRRWSKRERDAGASAAGADDRQMRLRRIMETVKASKG